MSKLINPDELPESIQKTLDESVITALAAQLKTELDRIDAVLQEKGYGIAYSIQIGLSVDPAEADQALFFKGDLH